MANINVNYSEIKQAALNLTTGKAEVESTLNRLQTLINNLVTSGFQTDTASGTFNETYTAFTQSATTTIGHLDKLSGYLNNAVSTLEQTDAALAAGAGH
ncbi:MULTISPECIES: WXG100 family type VII secretion target [unclassified Plantibacter]|uniref:WXG100 family type VII secretion target n=1 Tax=unclassified Plantibacter TaxID=2624265 RepID=UPI003D32932A